MVTERDWMKKKYVLFDLDGTLTDSREGIINSIEYMLRHYQMEVKDRSELQPWLGPPLKESLMKYCAFRGESVRGRGGVPGVF